MKRNPVFLISLGVTLAIILFGLALPETFSSITMGAFNFLIKNFSWLYLIAMLCFVVISLMVAFSKYGSIRLGPDDSRPEYSTFSWFAMLFGAGMGIGLVFWGVAEPINHYVTFGMTPEAAEFAMQKTFLHWGAHPWAGYAVMGMALGYFQYRKNAPGLISSIFVPLIGEKGVRGPIGKAIDICAVLATVVGIATSLGMGIHQINGGLNYFLGVPQTNAVRIALFAGIMLVVLIIALKGIDKGVKRLSDINMLLVILFLGGCFLIGPKLLTVNVFTNSLGGYLGNFLQESLGLEPFGDNQWLGGWTIFYWAWWISWGPFVGGFIARISKGRTLREFVMGVILAPSVASLIWFSVFGAMGLNAPANLIAEAAAETQTAMYTIFSAYPLGSVFSVLALVLLVSFFIISANSSTFVLSSYSSQGDLNPGKKQKILWGILQAALAYVMLTTDTLKAPVIVAFPFAFIMLLSGICLFKALRAEEKALK